MRTVLKALLVSCVLVALTGCTGVVGQWKMDSIKPETAAGEFPYGMICMAKDGTYAACPRLGEMKPVKGTYKYDQTDKMLTLTASDGKERTYKAEPTDMCNKLKVWSTDKGKEWTAVMTRTKCTCGKGPAVCEPATCPKECPMGKKAEAKPAEPQKAEPKKAEPAKKTEAKKAKEAKPAGEKP